MRRPLLLAIAIAACEGGGKSTTGATETGSTTDTTATTTEGGSAGTTTGGSTTSAGSTGPTTDGPTTESPVCSDRPEGECTADNGCMSIFGQPLDFPGCTPEPVFLFCNEEVPCDAVITTACKDGTDEAYQLANGCIPPGFSTCDPGLGPCGASACLGADERTCLADPACQAHVGAPHVTKMGVECSDFKNQVFVACGIAGPPCPPAVITACPEGQLDMAFDFASGCVPPGFVKCEDGPLAECP